MVLTPLYVAMNIIICIFFNPNLVNFVHCQQNRIENRETIATPSPSKIKPKIQAAYRYFLVLRSSYAPTGEIGNVGKACVLL